MSEDTSLGAVAGHRRQIARRFWSAAFPPGSGRTDQMELLPNALARACAEVLSVSAAGISLSNDDFRVPLGASNDTATYAERLQFTVGEGPCLEAYRQQDPLRATEQELASRWPPLHSELVRHTPYRSIVSLPLLRVEPGRGGAVDLYFLEPEAAAGFDVGAAEVAVSNVTTALGLAAGGSGDATKADGKDSDGNDSESEDLRRDEQPAWLSSPTAHRRGRVWTAIGILNVELQVSPSNALAIMRAHAYAGGGLLDDVAADLVEGRLSVDRLRAS